ncbi:MarR family winged helix-turn-helix transcriptional regulator [Sneathiella marina]|uniref:MarR family winged helix-turn-helix transcriptional regulator n=1 Tax=Sneathiella marina TaxID=2950108 RepID=A0ABY4W3T8_9PROT|nr:MarR family winged helix-turn-helix transcriptional regulator [Sneathiella marina]USG60557.1 MarR family winged helix-turn-helix transcriptional regulator [Sneathiella marina]
MSMQMHVNKDMKKRNDTTVKAWVALVKAHSRALATIENSLKAAGMPTLEWYDALLELERAGNQGIRPVSLRAELLLPQYGMSRLVDRLEKAGYLKRTADQKDGRGQRLFITGRGKKTREKMWTVYAPAMEEAVGGTLSQPELRQLTGLLCKLEG